MSVDPPAGPALIGCTFRKRNHRGESNSRRRIGFRRPEDVDDRMMLYRVRRMLLIRLARGRVVELNVMMVWPVAARVMNA